MLSFLFYTNNHACEFSLVKSTSDVTVAGNQSLRRFRTRGDRVEFRPCRDSINNKPWRQRKHYKTRDKMQLQPSKSFECI